MDENLEPMLEASIKVNKDGHENTGELLEVIIQQNSKNNPELLLEAILVQDKKNTKKITDKLNGVDIQNNINIETKETNLLLTELIREQKKECHTTIKLNLI